MSRPASDCDELILARYALCGPAKPGPELASEAQYRLSAARSKAERCRETGFASLTNRAAMLRTDGDRLTIVKLF